MKQLLSYVFALSAIACTVEQEPIEPLGWHDINNDGTKDAIVLNYYGKTHQEDGSPLNLKEFMAYDGKKISKAVDENYQEDPYRINFHGSYAMDVMLLGSLVEDNSLDEPEGWKRSVTVDEAKKTIELYTSSDLDAAYKVETYDLGLF